MNYVTGGPNGLKLVELTDGNGSSNILIVWDHAKTPGCANSKTAAPRGPWTPYTDAAAQTHYPLRHLQVFNTLFCDGHVTSMTQTELHDGLFLREWPLSVRTHKVKEPCTSPAPFGHRRQRCQMNIPSLCWPAHEGIFGRAARRRRRFPVEEGFTR